MLLYIYSEFSPDRGIEENEGRWWKKYFNSLFVSHASNQHCRFVPFLNQKVGKEPECLTFSTKYNVELQNVGDALLVSSHDSGFTLCSSFVSAGIWQLYALKVTRQLDNHLKKSNVRNITNFTTLDLQNDTWTFKCYTKKYLRNLFCLVYMTSSVFLVTLICAQN